MLPASSALAQADWLILHGGALGDLALTLQLALRVQGVKAESTVRVISRTNPGDLSDCRPSVERISSEGIGLHRLFVCDDGSRPGRLRELVTGQRVLSALGSVDSVVHRRLVSLGAREVYSFDPKPKLGSDAHITEQWRRELEGQGVRFSESGERDCDSGVLVVPDEVRERGSALFEQTLRGSALDPSPGPSSASRSPRQHAGRYVLIHPGSGGRAKCWPLPCFLDVGRQLRAAGLEVCFVLGPVEAECWRAEAAEAIRAAFPLIASPDPDELLSALAAARAVISNDAGPAHLAALIGTPTLTIFGPTSPTVWRPVGRDCRTLAGDPEAHPQDWGIEPPGVVRLMSRS